MDRHSKDRVHMNFWFPKDVADKLDKASVNSGVPMTEILTRLIRNTSAPDLEHQLLKQPSKSK